MKTMYSLLVGKWVDGRTTMCQQEEYVSIGKLAEDCHEGRIKSRDRTGQARSSDWPGQTKKWLFYIGVKGLDLTFVQINSSLCLIRIAHEIPISWD